jgi:hypothetical protein
MTTFRNSLFNLFRISLLLGLAAACGGSKSSTPGTTVSEGAFQWSAGQNTALAIASYGTKGVASASNVPGSRKTGTTWRDQNNYLWMFGGYGITSSASTLGYLNDLWRFDGTNWTWISGDATINGVGSYGALGIPASSNSPPARTSATSWIDLSGNLWLFGGQGPNGDFNDVWKFNGVTWIWVAGPQNLSSPFGNYGTRGVATTANQPGARSNAAGWSDAQGNFWMFSGSGYTNNSSGTPSDFWKFNVSNLMWTWVGGVATSAQSGNYGTLGVAASINIPGGRSSAAYWSDDKGNFWMFGGNGEAINGNSGYLNDLWKFDGTYWTWVAGTNTVNDTSVFGIKGTAASSNIPGGRQLAIGFSDSSNNQWIFGGTNGTVRFADFWKFDGSNWTWVYGSNVADQNGVYGTLLSSASTNYLGAREQPAAWVTSAGVLWLFGGFGADSGSGYSYLNDLWNVTP